MNASPPATHRAIELHFPSRNRHGYPIDQKPWVDLAIRTMCAAFGGAYEETVVGYWMGKTQTCLREETSRIVSYAEESQLRQNLPCLLGIAEEFMDETDQEMVLVAVDGNPHPIPARRSAPSGSERGHNSA